MDLHLMSFLAPVGLFYCFNRLSDGSLFLGIYGILAVYFSGVMIRLLLVLAPAACCLAAVGASTIISSFLPFIRDGLSASEKSALRTSKNFRLSRPAVSVVSLIGFIAVLGLGYQCVRFVQHCVWTSSMAYSSPSIVMSHAGCDSRS